MNALMIVGTVLLAIALVILGPIFTILAINTLFNTSIAYTFGTWCASFWLTAVFAGSAFKSCK